MGAKIAYVYLLRVPVLTWAFIAFVGPIAVYSPKQGIFLRNLFDLNVAESFWVGLFASSASCAALFSCLAICDLGPRRFGTPPLTSNRLAPWIAYSFLTVSPIAMLLFAVERFHFLFRRSEPMEEIVAALLGGVLIHIPLLMIALRLSEAVAAQLGPWFGRLPLVRAKEAGGYIERANPETHPVLRPEHVRTAALLLLYYLSFCVVSWYRKLFMFSSDIEVLPSPSGPSTLAFVLAAVTFFCLLGAGLTFWLDRYRIPLTLFVGMTAIPTVVAKHGDYLFHTSALPEHLERVSATGLLASRSSTIVVSAAGGGAQAAGWTALALGNLRSDNPKFGEALRIISGVSGGAVGTMYYLRTYPESSGSKSPAWSSDRAFRASVQSSLDAIAWGLVNFDLPGALWITSSRYKDRGSALEDELSARSGLGGVHLMNWAAAAGKGLPAVVFNATLAESGRPLLFSTVRLPLESGVVDFLQDSQQDIEIATAVRLSAGFPYVSPAARPAGGKTREHVVDGGYYDNSGTSTVLSLLTEACHNRRCDGDVLVVRIVAFPEVQPSTYSESSWLYDAKAPLDALLGVRNSSQMIRGERELQAVKDKLNVQETTLRYTPPKGCPEPSLSWQLTAQEIDCLKRAWGSLEKKYDISSFLNKHTFVTGQRNGKTSDVSTTSPLKQ